MIFARYKRQHGSPVHKGLHTCTNWPSSICCSFWCDSLNCFFPKFHSKVLLPLKVINFSNSEKSADTSDSVERTHTRVSQIRWSYKAWKQESSLFPLPITSINAQTPVHILHRITASGWQKLFVDKLWRKKNDFQLQVVRLWITISRWHGPGWFMKFQIAIST